jgi:glycosyltransferase involved in cell wall biosynthesis
MRANSMRILLLHNVVNPHMSPAFQILSQAAGVELTVAYFAEQEANRSWTGDEGVTFRRTILPGRELHLALAWDSFSVHYNPGLRRWLRETDWDVLINAGWMSWSNWLAFLECRRTGKPHVLWAGSTPNETSLQRTLTRPAVRYLVRHSDAFVSYGTASARYLESLGAPAARIQYGYHCVDNARFLASLDATREEVPRLRAQLGLAGKRVVLFVGRLVETKAGGVLVSAFARLAAEDPSVHLLFVGDGPRRAAWQAQADRECAGRATFVGHVELSKVAAYHQLAELFVLPSIHEVWGLAINEAALAGLPLVVSSACGAAVDLVEEGVNGHVVEPGDAAGLYRAMRRVFVEDRGAAMGQASRRRVARCSPAGLAEALLQAARAATRSTNAR